MSDIITINGVEYAPTKRTTGTRAVVVLDRGWIFAGDVTRQDGRIYMTRVVNLFRWESVGFPAVVKDPVGSKADIRPILDLDVPAGSEVFSIPVADDWGLV